jgi:hypothetical protein
MSRWGPPKEGRLWYSKVGEGVLVPRIEGVRVRSSRSSVEEWEKKVGRKIRMVKRAMKNAITKKTRRAMAVVEIMAKRLYRQDRKFSVLKID